MNFSHYKDLLIKIFLGLVLIGAVSACAEVYEWKDARGNRHYSDRAKESSKKVNIRAGYSYYTVDKVFDGDTVQLADGRKVRLLGINTPEVSHRNRPGQAGGEAAKAWLRKALLGRKVRLVEDAEPADKYNRTLAHVFTEGNEHINLQLVESGLAAVDIHPPNLLFADQLAAAQDRAEQAGRGIWGRDEYEPLPVDELTEDGHAGWLRLTGDLKTIRSSRKYIYLEFTDSFQAKVDKRWLRLFPDLDRLTGKELEVRGWLNRNRGGWSMIIRHPSALKVL